MRRGKAVTLKEGVSLRKCHALETIKKLHEAFPPVNSGEAFAHFKIMFRHLTANDRILTSRTIEKLAIFRGNCSIVTNKQKLHVYAITND